MKTFVSLHTAEPTSQASHEVGYAGYERMAIDFDEGFGKKPERVKFPVIPENAEGKITHIAIGSDEHLDGELALVMGLEFHLPFRKGLAPVVTIASFYHNANNEIVVDNLPINLNPIARVMHQLISAGQMFAEDLHPKLYEAMNDALHNAGVPVIPVDRQAAARWKPAAGLGMGKTLGNA